MKTMIDLDTGERFVIYEIRGQTPKLGDPYLQDANDPHPVIEGEVVEDGS